MGSGMISRAGGSCAPVCQDDRRLPLNTGWPCKIRYSVRTAQLGSGPGFAACYFTLSCKSYPVNYTLDIIVRNLPDVALALLWFREYLYALPAPIRSRSMLPHRRMLSSC